MGGGHQLLLHDPKGFDRSGVLVEVRDPLVLILFGVLDQQCRNGGLISNEPPVLTTLSQERP